MATQTINDQALIELIFEIFREHGYEGTSISQLSEATGLKKSSLYHRFPDGKSDMAKTLAAYVNTELTIAIINPLLNNEKSPESRLNAMVNTVLAFYCNGNKNCLLNVFCLGNINAELKNLLQASYNNWLGALIKTGTDSGLTPEVAKERAEHLLVVIEGAIVIQRLTNCASTFKKHLEYEKLRFLEK